MSRTPIADKLTNTGCLNHSGYVEVVELERSIATLTAELERVKAELSKLMPFYTKHALGSMTKPSCFSCGQVGEPAITHGELPSIYICKSCAAVKAERDALRVDAERYRWIRSVTSPVQIIWYTGENDTGLAIDALDAAIDAARGRE